MDLRHNHGRAPTGNCHTKQLRPINILKLVPQLVLWIAVNLQRDHERALSENHHRKQLQLITILEPVHRLILWIVRNLQRDHALALRGKRLVLWIVMNLCDHERVLTGKCHREQARPINILEPVHRPALWRVINLQRDHELALRGNHLIKHLPLITIQGPVLQVVL